MPRPSLTMMSSDDDPLARAIAPPPDESPDQRAARLQAEKEAKLRSDAIDAEINRQRQAEKKEQRPIKVLLLGQSESGKSTTLKNFQLINSPKAFKAERASWRAVIQLNVVRSIRTILDLMSAAQASSAYPSPASSPIDSPSESSRPPSPFPTEASPTLTSDHLKLRLRLGPLLQVEESLWRRLSPSSGEYEATHLSPVTNLPLPARATKEISIHSSSAWKNAFGRLLSNNRGSMDSEQGIDFDDPKDPGLILHNCYEDMNKLWNDETVRTLLRANRIRLEDQSGFFLDDLKRVTALKYIPSDEDILKARLKTIGVSEHRFVLKSGTGNPSTSPGSLLTKVREGNLLSRDWRVYDVGGARSLRAAWAPYFDDLDAIIFLAPLSPFDQNLTEDPEVNRLEDSLLLWKAIVTHPLLTKTNLILFLNKCDILKAKLNAGIQFNRTVLSYGDRPNTFEATSNYMKKKFGLYVSARGSFYLLIPSTAAIVKQSSNSTRPFYCHFTSVTDVKSTFQILENVKDLIVRQNLTDSHLV
ncbi:guanine nucleotide binding protein, alpha subunit [Dendrothele bispora CBS 962.96]|uniref:Guanine nucleotide binding protein, alpha subunit n=1 Tax=Dendrothele bispora (strain CBS 962.96) TaxID=1314807 RepID=A0A4S8MUC2_DENBC|nr:guanine nucleotide binding protein, alpha subunit [Dendrothele bispora CBS 962.96]